jgi:hypothetical protein
MSMDRAAAEEASMKIFLSSDMEGTAGVVDWEQCIGDGPQAMAGRQLLLDEVNAAIEGALAGGATEIVVNDSHSQMRNLPPQALAGQASYISGRHKRRRPALGLPLVLRGHRADPHDRGSGLARAGDAGHTAPARHRRRSRPAQRRPGRPPAAARGDRSAAGAGPSGR